MFRTRYFASMLSPVGPRALVVMVPTPERAAKRRRVEYRSEPRAPDAKCARAAVLAIRQFNGREAATTRACERCRCIFAPECFVNIQKRDRGQAVYNRNCRGCVDRAAEHLQRRCGPLRALLEEFKSQGCRNECPNKLDYFIIEADHVDPATKTHQLSDLVWWSRQPDAVEAFKAELRKCQPLCRPCHALKTRPQDPARALHYVDALKIARGACESDRPTCKKTPCTAANVTTFEMDHRDPAAKLRALAWLRSNSRATMSANAKALIDAEMQKCDMLCAACHLLVTLDQNRDKKRTAQRLADSAASSSPKMRWVVRETPAPAVAVTS